MIRDILHGRTPAVFNVEGGWQKSLITTASAPSVAMVSIAETAAATSPAVSFVETVQPFFDLRLLRFLLPECIAQSKKLLGFRHQAVFRCSHERGMRRQSKIRIVERSR